MRTTRIPREPGIYTITNNLNGKKYVGSARNLWLRWKEHRKFLNRGTHHSRHLQFAWNKYGGKDSFTFDVMLFCSKDNLLFYEQRAIDTLKVCDDSIGYNINPKARSSTGRIPTKEHLENMKEAGRKRNRKWTYKGKKYAMVELAELAGIRPCNIVMRLKHGWSVPRAVEEPININGGLEKKAKHINKKISATLRRKGRMLTYKGETKCVSDWAEELGIGRSAMHMRLRNGWSVERTLTTPKILRTP